MLGSLHRRFFLRLLAAAGAAAGANATVGCAAPTDEEDAEGTEDELSLRGYEYVVVGSGAGGGPLAANLARAGHKVLLLEAGEDRGNTESYQVPAFHARASEDKDMRWDFFVKHYSDEERARRDGKMVYDGQGENRTQRGVLYPRGSTLGGSTAMNAMITVYPHESDWNHIADVTGDDSWRPTRMRRYYEILERAEYLSLGADRRGHGFRGWLGVNTANATIALTDGRLLKIVKAAAITAGHGLLGTFGELIGLMRRDINSGAPGRDTKEGVFTIPLAVTNRGKRNGPREYLLETVRLGHPLTILTNSFATRVLFSSRIGDGGERKAIGVEFLQGKHQYKASPESRGAASGTRRRVIVKREVILAAGAFNTPQLLKLSGVGPREELTRFGIDVKVDLPGVGTNLQDRYEVGVISETSGNFSSVDKCTFGETADDPCLKDWRRGAGPYTTNGIAVAVVKKSRSAIGPDPDLFIFGGPAAFPGYYPGYSAGAIADKKHFTWAVLKAHTGNTAGTVSLKSADPRDTPDINFRYFDDGTTAGGVDNKDVDAVVEGIEIAREIGRHTGNLMGDDIPLVGGKFEEQVPGPRRTSKEQLREFVKDEAWGHHASCTCKIGADDDPMAVLDARFRVRGTSGLRVVDASVFPKIPGFFIVTPIYMVSEKATDVLLEDIGERR